MPLTVIDRPGERGSRFYDHHKAVAEFHDEYASNSGYYCEGKYGCLQFETEIRIEDSNLGRVSIRQKRILETVDSWETVNSQLSRYSETTNVLLHDKKNTSHTSIKPYTLFSGLLGYRKINHSPYGLKSKIPVTLSNQSLMWMKENKVHSAVQDEEGLTIIISRVFKTEDDMASLLDFLRNFFSQNH